MQDLNDKITGGFLTALEWNEVPSEIQNVIEALGLVLSSGDLNQLGKAIVGYASAGTFYSETGIANAYVATIIGTKQGLHALSAVTDGAIVRFRPGNVNTGASTLNVNSLGVKDIVRENGDVLSAGDLDITRDIAVRWDQTADDWRVFNSALLTPLILGLERPQEVLSGQLFRSSASVIQLRPFSGTEVVVGIDNKILTKTGNLSWDMAANLEDSESASQRLYLYVRDNAGVLDEEISSIVPDLPSGTKPGYKTGEPTWRCLGGTYNDIGQDLVKGTWGPGGVFDMAEHDADHEAALSVTASLSWQTDTELDNLNIPLSCTSVKIAASIGLNSGDGLICYGSDAATGTLTADASSPTDAGSGFRHVIVYMINSGASGRAGAQCSGWLPILTPSIPKIKFGITSNQDSDHALIVTGWRDMFAPK